jgi:hypothetical protein
MLIDNQNSTVHLHNHKVSRDPREKCTCIYVKVLEYPDMWQALLPNSQSFIGPGIDNSPVKPSISNNNIGEVISHPPITHVADFPALNTDESDGTRVWSRARSSWYGRQGWSLSLDFWWSINKFQTIVNASVGIKGPGSQSQIPYPLRHTNPVRTGWNHVDYQMFCL